RRSTTGRIGRWPRRAARWSSSGIPFELGLHLASAPLERAGGWHEKLGSAAPRHDTGGAAPVPIAQQSVIAVSGTLQRVPDRRRGPSDWGQASRVVADAYFPHELRLLGGTHEPRLTLRTVDLGHVLVGHVGWGA